MADISGASCGPGSTRSAPEAPSGLRPSGDDPSRAVVAVMINRLPSFDVAIAAGVVEQWFGWFLTLLPRAQAIDARSGETGTGSIGAADESADPQGCAQGPAA